MVSSQRWEPKIGYFFIRDWIINVIEFIYVHISIVRLPKHPMMMQVLVPLLDSR